MTYSRAFAAIQLGALVGFAVTSELPSSVVGPLAHKAVGVLWLCIVGALVVWAATWPVRSLTRILSCAAIACVAAGLWTIAYRAHVHAAVLPFDQTSTVSGRVTSAPQARNRFQQFTLDTSDFGAPARFLVRAPAEPVILMGSQLVMQGAIVLPTAKPGQFDYGHYLEGQGIVGIIDNPTQLELVSGPTGLLGYIGQIRHKIVMAFGRTLPEPAASLAAGLAIGVSPDIDAQFADALRRVSLTHLAAVSGQNLTLAVFLIFFFLRRRWLRGAIGAGLMLLIGYGVLVGNDPSIVRAAVMASLVFLAPLVGRPLFTPNALLLAATSIAFFNPLVVTRDVGFQLSFMVLGGLLILEPHIQQWFGWLPMIARQIVAPILTAALAAMPVQLATFGTISLVGPLANLLATPLAPVAMGGSMLLAILANLQGQLGQLAAWVVIVPLEGLHYIAIGLASWRYSQVAVEVPPTIQAVLLVGEAIALVAIGFMAAPTPAKVGDRYV